MRKLGNIRLALMCDRFDVKFKYSTPEKIDLFAFQILDLIGHKKKIPDEAVGIILSKLDIPGDLFNIYEDRFKELIDSPSPMIISELKNIDNYLEYPLSKYNLTDLGNRALIDQELPGIIKTASVSLVYNHFKKEYMIERRVTKADCKESLVVLDIPIMDMQERESSIKKEIENNKRKYLSIDTFKTKIYGVSFNPTSNYPILENAQIIEDSGKIKIISENEKINESLMNMSLENKQQIQDKMFKYYSFRNDTINFGNCKICNAPFKFKCAFANLANYSEMGTDNQKIQFYVPMEYNFAGLDEKSLPVLYKYTTYNADGFLIPIFEELRSDTKYQEIYNKAYGDIIDKVITSKGINHEKFEALLTLTPSKQRSKVFKDVISSIHGDYEAKLDKIYNLYTRFKENKSFIKIIQDSVLQIFNDLLASEKIEINQTLNEVKKFELEEKQYFMLIKKYYPFSDDIINKMILENETLTISAFELKKVYNEALISDTLMNYNHKLSMFSDFLNYDKQLKSMKKEGFKDYYDYEIPKTEKKWANFIAETNRLKSLYNRISDNLIQENKKGADDFFSTIYDIYYELAPIRVDTKGMFENTGDFYKDLEIAINGKTPMFEGIAAVIRGKYSEILHYLESEKEKKNNEKHRDRFGKELIAFVLEKKDVDEIYKHWRNMCALVHQDTEKDHPLVKGEAKDKKKALMGALNVYKQKLSKFERNNKDESSGDV